VNNTTYNLYDIPDSLRTFLKFRGIDGEEQLSRFLFPQLSELPRPETMANLSEASALVAEYIVAGKDIVVWGDYDVDGTTGTALLVNFFQEFTPRVSWHIPNRFTEGYGLNVNWFIQQNKLLRKKDFLVITVDCGISNKTEIEHIKAFGGRVIVTDHHRLPETGLPECLVLNPSQNECGFFGTHLAGAGVAFYLAAGVKQKLVPYFPHKIIQLKQYLAFVALGTIADVVELSATNRILVRAGMEALSTTTFPGLQELLASSGIEGMDILSEDIGYVLGPKINAAGRLGESDLAVSLFVEKSHTQAKKLATRLSTLNEQRKILTSEIFENIIEKLSPSRIDNEKCIIVEDVSHQGVAGIVASKLVELFSVPSLIFSKKKTSDSRYLYVGSARSVDGVNILAMLRECQAHLLQCGGHEMAAGLSVADEEFANFSKKFIQSARRHVTERIIQPRRRYDILCPVEIVLSSEYLSVFQKLEPFGRGNEVPVFLDEKSCIIDAKTVGRDCQHLQVSIRGRISNFKGIGFGLGKKIDAIQRSPIRQLLYSPTINRFRGAVSWQARVIDI
jgi:single-stranded-DNA-specific exonuclease